MSGPLILILCNLIWLIVRNHTGSHKINNAVGQVRMLFASFVLTVDAKLGGRSS